MTKLFAVGFPRDMEETELLEMFSVYGAVKSVKIITNQETGLSLGYGFISMDDEAGAYRAITALDGASIDDRKISVRVAEDKRGQTEQSLLPDKERGNARPKRPRRNTSKD